MAEGGHGAEALARIHRAAMVLSPAWSADAFARSLADRATFLLGAPDGFALGRAAAGEAELLIIAVVPAAQGRGRGRALLAAFEAGAAARGAGVAFLEVASDNVPARALYRAAGWSDAGSRRAYYARPGGPAADAVLMRKALPESRPPCPGVTARDVPKSS